MAEQRPGSARRTEVERFQAARVSAPLIKNKILFFGTYANQSAPEHAATANVSEPGGGSAAFFSYATPRYLTTVNVLQIGQGGQAVQTPCCRTQSPAKFAKITAWLARGALTQNPSDPNLAS